jgi:hypothetical protein
MEVLRVLAVSLTAVGLAALPAVFASAGLTRLTRLSGLSGLLGLTRLAGLARLTGMTLAAFAPARLTAALRSLQSSACHFRPDSVVWRVRFLLREHQNYSAPLRFARSYLGNDRVTPLGRKAKAWESSRSSFSARSLARSPKR